MMINGSSHISVIPAEAEIQMNFFRKMDPRLRGNDRSIQFGG